jgi:hypothetical protein
MFRFWDWKGPTSPHDPCTWQNLDTCSELGELL